MLSWLSLSVSLLLSLVVLPSSLVLAVQSVSYAQVLDVDGVAGDILPNQQDSPATVWPTVVGSRTVSQTVFGGFSAHLLSFGSVLLQSPVCVVTHENFKGQSFVTLGFGSCPEKGPCRNAHCLVVYRRCTIRSLVSLGSGFCSC